jgi:adenylyltransferase/sulfurtransferase
MTREELLRNSPHLILPEVGLRGRRLKTSSVLVVGAGGLGSPLVVDLAAAGMGRIGIVDDDRVDETNLQRQVLYGRSSLGRSKLQAARERLSDLNPNVRIETWESRLTSDNALEIIKRYDVVADGSDSILARRWWGGYCSSTPSP